MAKALEADFLLPTPCHSRERGLNGHTDGPPRRYPPKGTGFRRVTDTRVKRVRDILDARPGKVPGYLTPAEAFARARPPRGRPTRRTAGEKEGFRRARPGLRPGHPPSLARTGATSRRGDLPPPERPVTIRSEGTAAAFRVGSGSLAGKSFNPGPPPPLGATPAPVAGRGCTSGWRRGNELGITQICHPRDDARPRPQRPHLRRRRNGSGGRGAW